MALRAFFDDIVCGASVDQSCAELQDIKSALTELLHRYSADMAERSICRISRLYPCGSMVEKSALWKTNAEIYQANKGYRRKYASTYIEFDILAVLDASQKIAGVQGCPECFFIYSARLSGDAEEHAPKRQFSALQTDVIDKRFHAELHKSVTTMCRCFADCEIHDYKQSWKRNVYLYLNSPKAHNVKCNKCIVRRETGYIQVASFGTKFEAAKHLGHCSCVFKWTSTKQKLRMPDVTNLKRRKKTKEILVYVDFLPAFELTPLSVYEQKNRLQEKETDSSPDAFESDHVSECSQNKIHVDDSGSNTLLGENTNNVPGKHKGDFEEAVYVAENYELSDVPTECSQINVILDRSSSALAIDNCVVAVKNEHTNGNNHHRSLNALEADASDIVKDGKEIIMGSYTSNMSAATAFHSENGRNQGVESPRTETHANVEARNVTSEDTDCERGQYEHNLDLSVEQRYDKQEYEDRVPVTQQNEKELMDETTLDEHVWAVVDVKQADLSEHNKTTLHAINSDKTPTETPVSYSSNQLATVVTEYQEEDTSTEVVDAMDKHKEDVMTENETKEQNAGTSTDMSAFFNQELGGEKVVLAKSCTSCGKGCWRMSHSETENKTILENLSDEHRRCFMVIKYLFEQICLLSCVPAQMNGYHLKTSIIRHSSTCFRTDGDYVQCVYDILNGLGVAFNSRHLESTLAENNLLRKPGTPFPFYAEKIRFLLQILDEINATFIDKSCIFRNRYSAKQCLRIIKRGRQRVYEPFFYSGDFNNPFI